VVVFRPPGLRSGGGCFGPPSPLGLGRFVQYFFPVLICWMTRNHFKEALRGIHSPLVSLAAGVWCALVCLPFISRSTKYCRPQVDTRPPALLAAAIWSSRRDVTAEMIAGARRMVLTCQGVFSPRPRVTHVRATLRPFCRDWWLPVCWGVMGDGRVRLDGGACATHAVADGSSSNGCFCLGVFLFFQIVLNILLCVNLS
jgi:hypothetical protein